MSTQLILLVSHGAELILFDVLCLQERLWNYGCIEGLSQSRVLVVPRGLSVHVVKVIQVLRCNPRSYSRVEAQIVLLWRAHGCCGGVEGTLIVLAGGDQAVKSKALVYLYLIQELGVLKIRIVRLILGQVEATPLWLLFYDFW